MRIILCKALRQVLRKCLRTNYVLRKVLLTFAYFCTWGVTWSCDSKGKQLQDTKYLFSKWHLLTSIIFLQLPLLFWEGEKMLPKHFFSRLCSKSPCCFCKDNRIFLNWDRKFLIVSCHFVFDLSIREAIKQNINSNVIQTGLRIFLIFFLLLPYVSFPAFS